uniref:Uncharacterized protein n=1 Tax=Oryza meridionalis TaxID=40149 RepID=A0A0E0EAA0_9ORYZ
MRSLSSRESTSITWATKLLFADEWYRVASKVEVTGKCVVHGSGAMDTGSACRSEVELVIDAHTVGTPGGRRSSRGGSCQARRRVPVTEPPEEGADKDDEGEAKAVQELERMHVNAERENEAERDPVFGVALRGSLWTTMIRRGALLQRRQQDGEGGR